MIKFPLTAKTALAVAALAAATFGSLDVANAGDRNTRLINKMIHALDYSPRHHGGHYGHRRTYRKRHHRGHYGYRAKRHYGHHDHGYGYGYGYRSPSLGSYRGYKPDYGYGGGDYGYGYGKLKLDVYFTHGSARFTPAAKEALEALGYALTSDRLKGRKFLIAGHTDASGPDYVNRELSQQRAIAVKRYLVDYFDIDPHKLVAVGFGEDRPVDKYNPYAGVNRRVEVLTYGKHIAHLVDGYDVW